VEPLTYSSYLKLDGLLDQQQPLSEGPEHDEMLFIIIHQAYELWFKQILHEMDHLVGLLASAEAALAVHTLKRVMTIFKVLVHQLDVLETMTPLEFKSFRDRLESASGFQSAQFREVEFLLGFKQRQVLDRFPEGSRERMRLEKRLVQPTLWDAFLRCLARHDYRLPASSMDRDVTGPVEPSVEVQEVLLDIYRGNPGLSQICELLVDLDEGVQEWRYRHVRMVERTIGNKIGTGGSSGVEYLKTTLFRHAFPDLWAIRNEM
jgi:tryptophan 2,3-dioxygenase